MKSLSFIRQLSFRRLCPLLWVVLWLGCKREDSRVYYVSKEEPKLAAEPAPPAGGDMTAPDMTVQPTLVWSLPDGWQEKSPGEMRVASFTVMDQDGQSADVSVIPLPGLGGRELENVNRWRGQVGLSPVTQDELASQTEQVEIAGSPASLFDLAGVAGDGSKKTRILAAILDRGGMTWFFKMMGNDTLVANQRPAFVGFLQSLKFTAGEAKSALPSGHPPVGGDLNAPTPPVVSANEGKPAWVVPPDWQELPASEFLLAKFLVQGSGGAKAEVNVSSLAGTGGGLLANVNRWRGQAGLPPIDEADLAKQISPIEVPGGQAAVADMSGMDGTGRPARLIGVVVPQAGQTWFYKLMGDEQIVGHQKDAFIKFIQSVRYSNVR